MTEAPKTQPPLKPKEREAWAQGSAAMLATVHCALDNRMLSFWLNHRVLASRYKKPPFPLPEDIKGVIRREVFALGEKMRVRFTDEELAMLDV